MSPLVDVGKPTVVWTSWIVLNRLVQQVAHISKTFDENLEEYNTLACRCRREEGIDHGRKCRMSMIWVGQLTDDRIEGKVDDKWETVVGSRNGWIIKRSKKLNTLREVCDGEEERWRGLAMRLGKMRFKSSVVVLVVSRAICWWGTSWTKSGVGQRLVGTR